MHAEKHGCHSFGYPVFVRDNRSDIRLQYLRCRCLYLYDLYERRKAERKCDDDPSRASLFEFFKIPFSGKLVDKDAQGFVYISEQFKEQLQRDSIAGSVTLDGKEYRIAGTYRALNREDTQSSSVGSVFLVNPQAYTYYFKTLHSDITPVALEKITEICRRYVPETLPLNIRNTGDSKQSVMGTVALLQTASLLLAIVSILLLILSIYSGISMDVINRQKKWPSEK